jgi:uncharacterized protein YqeY
MLKQRLQQDMKTALKAGDKDRLGTIRLIHAAIKQREIDERIELDDQAVLAVLEKMVKQRRDSLAQYQQAGREDLAAKEAAEIDICQSYLPEPLSEAELDACIAAAIAETGATSMREMGQVMGRIKPQVQGRADMGALSTRVKQRLSGG